MKLVLAAGMVMAVLAGAPALAQQPDLVIGFLDKNGDGKCDLNEYLGYQQSKFAGYDTDQDGELNLAEFKGSLQGKAKKTAEYTFKGANGEGGRTLTQREFLGYHAWVFNNFVDTDKDGFMSAAEWTKITGLG